MSGQAVHSGSDRGYWICQLGGWSCYAAGNALLGLAMGSSAAGRWLAMVTVVCALGIGVTHALRAFMRRRRWTELSVARAAPRILLASIAGGIALHLGTTMIAMLLGLIPAGRPPARTLEYTFNLSATVLIWTCIYFGAHYFQRSQQARTAALRAELAARETELALLRSQLNPHFLFNCLNSVRALISEAPSRAQGAVTQLADLLRYTLQAADRRTVTLNEELAAVTDYLRLEGLRLEDRLDIDLDVEPGTLSTRIPAMLLQTLVENAIKHGITRLPQGGTVGLSVRRAGDGLRIEVSNPSPAVDQPRADAPAGGIGLANARQRLRLLYGPAATLELRQTSTSQQYAERGAARPVTMRAEVNLPSLLPPG